MTDGMGVNGSHRRDQPRKWTCAMPQSASHLFGDGDVPFMLTITSGCAQSIRDRERKVRKRTNRNTSETLKHTSDTRFGPSIHCQSLSNHRQATSEVLLFILAVQETSSVMCPLKERERGCLSSCPCPN